jgi:hypothetical protein
MPAGRPSKYSPEMCDVVVELGKEGASKHEMALELGIHIDTFIEWVKDENKPEFSEAVKKAVSYSQGWWEKKGRQATMGGVDGFNPTSFIFNMKNRFPGDWKDKRETEHSGGVTIKKATVEFIDGPES